MVLKGTNIGSDSRTHALETTDRQTSQSVVLHVNPLPQRLKERVLSVLIEDDIYPAGNWFFGVQPIDKSFGQM